jgi:hypothetical protein
MEAIPKTGNEMNTPIYDALVADFGDPVAIGYGFLRILGGQQEQPGKRRAKHKKPAPVDDVT